jgi:hypothetical protein
MDKPFVAKLKELADQGVVVDVDVSEWDRRIRFVLAKPREELSELSGDSDVFNVDFIRTSIFKMDLTRPLDVEVGDQRHTRWTLWGATIRQLARGLDVQLRGAGPEVHLECEDIEISVLDTKSLNSLSPDWFQPGQPLARGGVEILISRMTGKRSGRSSK